MIVPIIAQIATSTTDGIVVRSVGEALTRSGPKTPTNSTAVHIATIARPAQGRADAEGWILDAVGTNGLSALVQAPAVLDFLAGKGIVVSDSVATREAQGRGIASPSDSTLEIVKLANAIQAAQQSGQITEADSVVLSEQLAAQEVVVNPRYGTFDPQTASIALGTPEWIRPVDAAP